MGLLSFWPGLGRRRSPFNNIGPRGLTCGLVTRQLYVGGELGPQDCLALAQEGVTNIINLQQEQQDIFTPREKGQLTGYLWLPSPDGMAPTVDQLAAGVAFIRAAIAAGQGVFVHCKAGQGRAPLLCACYLISEGAPMMEAIAEVRKARPQTLLTPDQSLRLRQYAAALNRLHEEEASAAGLPEASGATNEPSSNGGRPGTGPLSAPEVQARPA